MIVLCVTYLATTEDDGIGKRRKTLDVMIMTGRVAGIMIHVIMFPKAIVSSNGKPVMPNDERCSIIS